MICRNCGQEIPEGSMFCQNCGQAANENSTDINNQQYSGQEYYQYNNEPYMNQEYSASNNNPTIVDRISLAIGVILVILFLKSCVFGSSYKTPLDDIIKIVNKKQTNIEKIADAVIPEILSDSYDEIIDILKSNKEYKKDFKTLYNKDFPDTRISLMKWRMFTVKIQRFLMK